MGETTIAWTDYTLNFWRGCTKVGPGCDACYAEARDRRYEGGMHWGPGAPRILASEAVRNAPYKWAKQVTTTGKRRVFVSSLSDVFDNEVDPTWRRALFDTIRRTPQLRYQLVTKRISNAADMLPAEFPRGFEHVGVIATVVNQQEADRDVPRLRALKARSGFTWIGLSVEPQLGPIALPTSPTSGFSAPLGVDWVICGGESVQPPHKPRPFDLAWARSLRDQCDAAAVPFFMKQIGSRPVSCVCTECADTDEPEIAEDPPRWRVSTRDRAGADPDEWPSDIRVRQFPAALC
jgi:protein gp37